MSEARDRYQASRDAEGDGEPVDRQDWWDRRIILLVIFVAVMFAGGVSMTRNGTVFGYDLVAVATQLRKAL